MSRHFARRDRLPCLFVSLNLAQLGGLSNARQACGKGPRFDKFAEKRTCSRQRSVMQGEKIFANRIELVNSALDSVDKAGKLSRAQDSLD